MCGIYAKKDFPNHMYHILYLQGVDVEACSFVISFDAIKTVKSYIQMKGRARQKNAKFFVFADDNVSSQPLSLNNALAVENMVQNSLLIAKKNISVSITPLRIAHMVVAT